MESDRGQQTRARIAIEALKLLQERGASGLTMRQVALRSGLSLSNVQYHYKSREQLLIGMTEYHLAQCRGALVRGVERAGELTLRSVLRVSLCDVEVWESAPAFRELFALARLEDGVSQRLNDYYAAQLQELAGLLSTLAPVSKARSVEIATLLMTSIEGAYLLRAATPVSMERLADQLEETALTLLRQPPRSN